MNLGQTIGPVLVYALGVALSPIPIIGVVVMLATPRGTVNGWAFIVGWVVGLAVAGTAALLILGGAGVNDTGSQDGTNWVRVGLGVLLIVVAGRQWRKRPKAGETAELPAWLKTVDHFTPVKAAGMGVLLSAVNPKNLLLIIAADAAIAQSGASTEDQAIGLAVFVVIAALGPLIPVVISAVMGERGRALLQDLHDWMARENHAIMAIICLLIGVKVIGDGIGGF